MAAAGSCAMALASPANHQSGEHVVVDPAVCVQRAHAQARCEARDDRLIRPERLGQCARFGTAVACEQCGGRPSVQHQCTQPVGVAGRVGEPDAAAVAGGVELDMADSEFGANGIQIGRRGAAAVRVAPIADTAGAPAAACVDQHDVAAIAQRIEQRQHRRAVGRGGHAVVAGADEYGVARLPCPAVGVELESDLNGSGRGIGRDERHRDRAAARAAGHGRRSAAAAAAGSTQAAVSATIAIRAHGAATSASPHPAQLGSHRCSNEMCGAPVSSARRNAR